MTTPSVFKDEKAVARRVERLMKEAKEAVEEGERKIKEAEAKGKAEGQRNLTNQSVAIRYEAGRDSQNGKSALGTSS